MLQLYFHQVVCFKLHGMAHLYCTTLGKHMYYFICCCCLHCILCILIVNANAGASVITAFYLALIAVL